MASLQETESEEKIGQFLAALWFIWEERNCQQWNKKKREEYEIMGKSERWLLQYLEYQSATMATGPRQAILWKPPDRADFKINVDAATFTGAGTGLGVVIRDKNGGCCFAGVRRSRTQWTAELAEIQAIKLGLEVAIEMGYRPGEIETDCLRVVQQIGKEEESLTEEGAECEEMRDKLAGLSGEFSVSFLGRDSNRAAHIMAHTQCGWHETEF
ncbi:unnamed protein product [Linum trigynum]|uniref:RNase H type-1 domain-containing protein n=1 Tax=Linum trigynum TaxID=586398 RepID=A0AAV2GUA0_9ROSI